MMRFLILMTSIALAAGETCFFAPAASGDSTQYKVCVNATTGLMTVVDGGNVVDAHAATTGDISNLSEDLDAFYLIVVASMVFLMQAGFSLVEAGNVGMKNVQNILYKNVMDAVIGCLSFWLIGYGFAYGGTDDNRFIGVENFALSNLDNGSLEWAGFFFQYVFAATTATIVSGAVAERCKLEAYFIYSTVCVTWIYPVVVHWVWDDNGWLSAFNGEYSLFDGAGMIDFAGSGVVHMVGGVCALIAAKMMGPRLGRFDVHGKPNDVRGHSMTLAALGVFLLWFGWFGFNAGSTLAASGGGSKLGGKVAVVTTISAAASCLTTTMVSRVLHGHFEVGYALNGVLGGLVGITAGCSVVDPWAALVIGIISGLVYYGSSSLLLRLQIDDPVDAVPVHGFCGAWGVLAVGIFATSENIAAAGYSNPDNVSSGLQFATQLVGVLAIVAWTAANAFILFFVIDKTVGLRVSHLEEVLGLDVLEHGGDCYAGDDEIKQCLDKALNIFRGQNLKHAHRHFDHDETRVLKQVFDLFDQDLDDNITHDEVAAALRTLQVDFTEQQLQTHLGGKQAMDFDGFIRMMGGITRSRSQVSVRGMPEPRVHLELAPSAKALDDNTYEEVEMASTTPPRETQLNV